MVEYTMDTGTGFVVTVWTYGASLLGVTVPDRFGRLANVVRRLPSLAAHRRVPYVGSTMGRYCRCVSGARFSLDGKEYSLDRNDGPHHLHGGSVGFDRHVWEAETGSDSGWLFVRLRLESPDGDQGYPGAVTVETVYRAHPSGRLVIEFSATTSASTLIGLTNHAFWNLAGDGTVDGHRLAINASRFIPFDGNLIPLPGPPAPVDALDHRSERDVGVLDNFFVLDDPEWAAELTDPGSGRVLRIRTDQPGIGVYSGDGFVWPRAGICLQTGAWPDAPNRPDYPPVRLDPGMTYRAGTTYEFTTAPASR